MASYVTLINFTERGELHIKDTCKRAESFKAKAKGMGITCGPWASMTGW